MLFYLLLPNPGELRAAGETLRVLSLVGSKLMGGSDHEAAGLCSAAVAAPASVGSAGPSGGQLIGREVLSRRLMALIAVARQGSPQICILTGAAGTTSPRLYSS